MNMGGAGGSSLIHVSHYSAGVMVGASPISEDVDCVIGVCPDMGAITQDSWCEMPSTIYIDGKTWAISEIPLHVLSGKTKKKSSRAIAEESGGGSVLNEFNTQLTQPTRKFLILTNSGVTVLSKKRPIDVLQQLVIDANSLITPIIRVFFDR